MILAGNIFLFLATCIYVMLLSAAYGHQPAWPGAAGSAKRVTGRGWVFGVCMVLVAVVLGGKDGFEWIAADSSTAWIVALLGLASIIGAALLTAVFRFEPVPPRSVRYLTGFAPLVFPAVLLLAAAILLNDPIRAMIPVSMVNIPLLVVSGISILVCLARIIERIAPKPRTIPQSEEISSDEEGHLATIASTNAMHADGLLSLLDYTDSNQHRLVREKALAKIKSNANWQQVLVAALQSEHAPRVFTFLASNEVNDKALFLEPVREGILQLAESIRRDIKKASHPSHFSTGQFSRDIDHMLATVEHFKGMGTDYLPALKEVRAALDTPSDPPELRKRVSFNAATSLDWWIRQYERG